MKIEAACKSKIRGGVVRTDERVASPAGEAIVAAVAIAVRITLDPRVKRTATANGDYAGHFPVVEYLGQEGLSSIKRLGGRDPGECQPVTLVGDTRSAFSSRGIGILYSGGTPCN